MGKSTLAAQFCAGGARLVTDDVLPLALDGDVFIEGRGSELRLRENAADLLHSFEQPPASRRTADDRLAIRLGSDASARVRLDTIVIPGPSREVTDLSVVRLSQAEAMLALSSYPRVLGWRDPEVLRRQFELIADVVARVPVHQAVIPWGPPFPPEIPRRLVTRLYATE
jgi:hypothetical protein